MDYEARETLAKAYKFLRIQQELISELTNSVDSLVKTLVTVDPQTHKKYAAAMEDSKKSEQAKGFALALQAIDSVISTLR